MYMYLVPGICCSQSTTQCYSQGVVLCRPVMDVHARGEPSHPQAALSLVPKPTRATQSVAPVGLGTRLGSPWIWKRNAHESSRPQTALGLGM